MVVSMIVRHSTSTTTNQKPLSLMCYVILPTTFINKDNSDIIILSVILYIPIKVLPSPVQ